jgi:hypothetical protein
MKRFAKTALVVCLGAFPILGVVASPALADCGLNAGHFCAFRHNGYSDQILHSAAGAGTDFVDVADNITSSVKNSTNNYWCGVHSDGWPDSTVLRVSPDTNLSALGGANDTIDHFYVRSPAVGCD